VHWVQHAKIEVAPLRFSNTFSLSELLERRVQRHRTRTTSGHVQEKKAVEDGFFAAIQDWPKASWGVSFEVSDCHFSAGKECGNTGAQS